MNETLPDIITNDTVINLQTEKDIWVIKLLILKMKYQPLSELEYNNLLKLIGVDPTKYSYAIS